MNASDFWNDSEKAQGLIKEMQDLKEALSESEENLESETEVPEVIDSQEEI